MNQIYFKSIDWNEVSVIIKQFHLVEINKSKLCKNLKMKLTRIVKMYKLINNLIDNVKFSFGIFKLVISVIRLLQISCGLR